jgi:hypothetical protein
LDASGKDDAFFGFLLEAELAAGGIDVVAFFEAQGGGDAGVFEEHRGRRGMGVGRAFPFESLDVL